MNLKSSLPIFATAMMAFTLSVSATAASHLSHQQCVSYPFKKTVGEVSHGDLMTELGELEVRGYQPGSDNGVFPADLNAAENALEVDYKRDCLVSHR